MRFFTFILLMSVVFQIEAQEFQSKKERVHLIELYSSEGCSSCPPAEKWVVGLEAAKGLWTDFIPIEFHVDYWNRLGWVDPFSQKKFTRRQRLYSHKWGSSRVYTPGFVLDGKEWPLGTQRVPPKSNENVGVLKVKKVKDYFEVEFASPLKKTLKINGALLGHGLQTEVPRGENAGKILKHEFVVLEIEESNLSKVDNIYKRRLKLPTKKNLKVRSFSLVFWASDSQTMRPIQVVGGPLKN